MNSWRLPESLEKVIPVQELKAAFGAKRVPKPLLELYCCRSYRQPHGVGLY